MSDDKCLVLEIRDLHAGYGEILALRGISLKVRRSKIVTILGANGAGKTTLLKTISGIIKPKAGSIDFANASLIGLSPSQIVARGVSQVPEGREVFSRLSVDNNLNMGAYLRRNKSEIEQEKEWCYTLFPLLRQKAETDAGLLSGGQQQMLAIARALMSQPKLLMLDEPSLGLAPLISIEVSALIKRLNQEQGLTVLLVEQNANLALKIADYGYVMENGQIRLHAPAEDLRNHPLVRELYFGSLTNRESAL